MTDRREAVARAIYGAEQAMFSEDAGIEESAEDIARDLDDHSMRDPDFNHYWRMADAALSAIAASEPTDAEIEAASEAAWDVIVGQREFAWRRICAEGDPEWQSSIDDQRRAMRAALIAARKVSQP